MPFLRTTAKVGLPHISLLRCGILFLTLATPPCVYAQGCSQCRDNTAATSPKTQAAYRHAIILLVATAGSLFAGTVFMLKRSR